MDKNRIEKLLSGKLFPMKAVSYFAVIAGTGKSEESIADIMAYEQEYLENSNFVK